MLSDTLQIAWNFRGSFLVACIERTLKFSGVITEPKVWRFMPLKLSKNSSLLYFCFRPTKVIVGDLFVISRVRWVPEEGLVTSSTISVGGSDCMAASISPLKDAR